MKKIFVLVSGLLTAMTSLAADVQTSGNQVTIRPDGGQAKVIRLEVIVPQTAPAKGSYSVSDEGETVVVKARNVKAVVSKSTGEITFFDGDGNQLLQEAKDGKQFWDFTVPEREYGLKGGPAITEEMKHGLTWQMKFDSPDDEAFYGLGQHQSEEFNMKGKNEDLFQYNTKV